MTEPSNILVPTDFSESANAALAYAKLLAEKFGARLYVLHVLQSPFTYLQGLEMSPQMALLREDISRDAGSRLERLLTPQEKKRFNARIRTEWGIPDLEIVDYSVKNEIDLLVMGSHGHGPIRRMFLGSVADKVIRHGHCPVLTVRAEEHNSELATIAREKDLTQPPLKQTP